MSFSDFILSSVHKIVILQEKLKNITYMYTKTHGVKIFTL